VPALSRHDEGDVSRGRGLVCSVWPRVKAAAVYLNIQQLIPEDWVAKAMNDCFDLAGQISIKSERAIWSECLQVQATET
jgi:hypothetical protein